MSRQLPERPNLEHLRKQAKELLRGMRQGKLADAQHALANEYGFATWASLKAHVEELTLSPAEALTAAVRDTDAARVAGLLERHPDAAGGDRRSAAELWPRSACFVCGGATERSGNHRRAAQGRRKHP